MYSTHDGSSREVIKLSCLDELQWSQATMSNITGNISDNIVMSFVTKVHLTQHYYVLYNCWSLKVSDFSLVRGMLQTSNIHTYVLVVYSLLEAEEMEEF